MRLQAEWERPGGNLAGVGRHEFAGLAGEICADTVGRRSGAAAFTVEKICCLIKKGTEKG